MVEKPNEQQLKKELLKLGPKEHLMVLNYIRTLTARKPGLPTGSQLIQFAGKINATDLKLIAAAIESSCERVDRDGW